MDRAVEQRFWGVFRCCLVLFRLTNPWWSPPLPPQVSVGEVIFHHSIQAPEAQNLGPLLSNQQDQSIKADSVIAIDDKTLLLRFALGGLLFDLFRILAVSLVRSIFGLIDLVELTRPLMIYIV